MQSLERYLQENNGIRVIVHAGNQTVDSFDVLSGLMLDVLKPNVVISEEEIDGIKHVTVDPNQRV